MSKKEKMKQKIHKQTEENIKELKEMGIHYIFQEEYDQHPEKYKYAIGIVPTYKPEEK